MKKSEKLLRRAAITLLALCFVEIVFILTPFVCLFHGRLDWATYLLVLTIVVDQQGGGLRSQQQGAIEREMEIEELESHQEAVRKKTFSERVEELHRKNNNGA